MEEKLDAFIACRDLLYNDSWLEDLIWADAKLSKRSQNNRILKFEKYL